MNYQIENDFLKLEISDIGAELKSIQKDGVEYLWSGDKKYWAGQSPVLFPFVGRLTNGKYYLDGKEYEMNPHGFARKQVYSVVEKTDDSILFELTDNAETLKSYPYHFSLRLEYELVGNEIKVTYRVYNLSEEIMYFGIGGHPAKTDAPFVCIEPWATLPSRQDVVEEFRYKSDMIRLEADDVYENTWSIVIE